MTVFKIKKKIGSIIDSYSVMFRYVQLCSVMFSSVMFSYVQLCSAMFSLCAIQSMQSTVQYSTVQYSTQYSTVQYNRVE